MRTPPPAYYTMRAAYARWFYELPASLLLLGIAVLVGRVGQPQPSRWARMLHALFFTAGVTLLLSSVKERAVYETSRALYDATPDTMPDTMPE